MIGGKPPLDQRHLARIAEWHAKYGFRWYSEHLALAPDPSALPASEGNVPLAYDRGALRRVIDRVREVQAYLPIPFLLENNAYAAGVPQQEMSEPMFLNRLCAATGCGLLLDVHSLCANALNCGIDALSFLDRIDLTRVVEAHVAAGPATATVDGCVPTALCPPSVHEVLEAAMWRAPKLRAVTIEVHDFGGVGTGDDEVLGLLESARRIWKLYH
jgi:uncharacterized protein (UPF0276 family)